MSSVNNGLLCGRHESFVSSISVSEMVMKTMKMRNALDAPSHQQPLKKWLKWVWTIAESQSEKSLMILHMVLLMPWNFFKCFGYGNPFCSKVFIFIPNIAANGSCSRVAKLNQWQWRIVETYYNRWRNTGLQILRRNYTSIVLVEAFWFARTEEGLTRFCSMCASF